MTFQSLFASPMGRTARGPFVGALIVLLLAAAFYAFLVHAGRNGEWVLVTLLYPAIVLHARRLHDMGKTAWLLAVPGALFAASIWFTLIQPDPQLSSPVTLPALGISANPVTLAALGVSVVFALWGLVGKGQPEANRFGAAA